MGHHNMSTGYIVSNTSNKLTLDANGWNMGTPPVPGTTYTINPGFASQLGRSLGLDYYNGKFWSAWANESSDPATSPNPDYFPATDVNHNPGDPQHTTNIYGRPMTVTITASPRAASFVAAAVAAPSAPAHAPPSAVLTALLTQRPDLAIPATTTPLPPRDPVPPSAPVPALAPRPVDALFASMSLEQQPVKRPSSSATEPDALELLSQADWHVVTSLGE
jgi:hypothetical protein